MGDIVERLREHATDWNGEQMPDLEPAKADPTAGTLRYAADAIESLRAENARLTKQVANLEARGIHSCNDECQRPLCVAQRENERLREALEAIAGAEIRSMEWQSNSGRIHDIECCDPEDTKEIARAALAHKDVNA